MHGDEVNITMNEFDNLKYYRGRIGGPCERRSGPVRVLVCRGCDQAWVSLSEQ